MKKLKLILGIALIFSAISIPTVSIGQQQAGAQEAVKQVKQGVQRSGGSENKTELTDYIEIITNILLFLIGIIAVIVIVISGLKFVTSNGNQDQVTSARNGVIYAVVGIVVAVMAYAIVRFVIGNLG